MKNIEKLSPLIAICFGVLLPRLFVIGNFPGEDEVFYIFQSWLFLLSDSDNNYLNYQFLFLYPAILSWLLKIDLNVFILFRLIDLFVALFCAYYFFKISFFLCKSHFNALIITVLVFFHLNNPVFIESGFKNSIFISLLLLTYGIYSGLVAEKELKKRNFILIGFLLFLSICFRESFILILLLVLALFYFCIELNYFKKIIYGIFGGLLLILTFIQISRGEFNTLLAEYFSLKVLYFNDIYGKYIFSNFSNNLTLFLKNTFVFQIFFIYSLVILFKNFHFISFNNIKLYFVLILILIVMTLEPILKISAPYHFSLFLIPLGLMISISLNQTSIINHSKFFNYKFLLLFLTIFLLLTTLYFKFSKNQFHFINSNNILEVENSDSALLQVSKDIYSLKKKDDSFTMSGLLHSLYFFNKFKPINRELIDLTESYIYNDFSKEKLRSLIIQSKPNIIFINKSSERLYFQEIIDVIQSTGIYKSKKSYSFKNPNAISKGELFVKEI